MYLNFGLPKKDITLRFCSLVVVKVTFVVSSSKNIFITVPSQFVKSFLKLFSATDSRLSAHYLI